MEKAKSDEMTLGQVADYLRVSKKTVREYEKGHYFSHIRRGGWRKGERIYLRQDIIDFIDACPVID